MNLAAVCAWTVWRSLAIVIVSVPLCWWILDLLAVLSKRGRLLLWTLLLLPFLTPALLSGYGYSSFSLSLIRQPFWNEVFYSLLSVLRFLPAGVLAMQHLSAAPVSAEALHCARLALARDLGWYDRLRRLWPYYIRGPWRAALPAAGVIFLLSFQEFEVASLMGIRSWTVWIFDAQVGGVLLPKLLRLVMVPCLCQIAILGPLIALAVRSQWLCATSKAHVPPVRRIKSSAVWLVSLLGVTLCTFIPLAITGRGALTGLATVLENRQMVREILIAGGFGMAGGLLATAIAIGVLRLSTDRSRPRTAAMVVWTGLVLSLPGLMGSLAISLVLLGLLQWGPLIPVRDSVVPGVVAITLFLLPRAICLQWLAEATTPRTGLYVAQLLAQSPISRSRQAGAELYWHLRLRKQSLAAGVICLWGYLELTPCYLLLPPGMTSAPARLYNLMHYGRSHVLSAMVLLTMLAPVGAFLGAAWLRRIVTCWLART